MEDNSEKHSIGSAHHHQGGAVSRPPDCLSNLSSCDSDSLSDTFESNTSSTTESCYSSSNVSLSTTNASSSDCSDLSVFLPPLHPPRRRTTRSRSAARSGSETSSTQASPNSSTSYAPTSGSSSASDTDSSARRRMRRNQSSGNLRRSRSSSAASRSASCPPHEQCDQASGAGDDYQASGAGDDYQASGAGDDYQASGAGDDYQARGQEHGEQFPRLASLEDVCTQSQYEYMPPSFSSSTLPCQPPQAPGATGYDMQCGQPGAPSNTETESVLPPNFLHTDDAAHNRPFQNCSSACPGGPQRDFPAGCSSGAQHPPRDDPPPYSTYDPLAAPQYCSTEYRQHDHPPAYTEHGAHAPPPSLSVCPLNGAFSLPPYRQVSLPHNSTFSLPQNRDFPLPHYGASSSPQNDTSLYPQYGASSLPHYGAPSLPQNGEFPLPLEELLALPFYRSPQVEGYGTSNAPNYGYTVPPPINPLESRPRDGLHYSRHPGAPQYNFHNVPYRSQCICAPQNSCSAMPHYESNVSPCGPRTDSIPHHRSDSIPYNGSPPIPHIGSDSIPHRSDSIPHNGSASMPHHWPSAAPQRPGVSVPRDRDASFYRELAIQERYNAPGSFSFPTVRVFPGLLDYLDNLLERYPPSSFQEHSASASQDSSASTSQHLSDSGQSSDSSQSTCSTSQRRPASASEQSNASLPSHSSRSQQRAASTPEQCISSALQHGSPSVSQPGPAPVSDPSSAAPQHGPVATSQNGSPSTCMFDRNASPAHNPQSSVWAPLNTYQAMSLYSFGQGLHNHRSWTSAPSRDLWAKEEKAEVCPNQPVQNDPSSRRPTPAVQNGSVALDASVKPNGVIGSDPSPQQPQAVCPTVIPSTVSVDKPPSHSAPRPKLVAAKPSASSSVRSDTPTTGRGRSSPVDEISRSRPRNRKHRAPVSVSPAPSSRVIPPRPRTSTPAYDPRDPGMPVASPIKYTDHLDPITDESMLSRKFVTCCSCRDQTISQRAASSLSGTEDSDPEVISGAGASGNGSVRSFNTSNAATCGSSYAEKFNGTGDSSNSQSGYRDSPEAFNTARRLFDLSNSSRISSSSYSNSDNIDNTINTTNGSNSSTSSDSNKGRGKGKGKGKRATISNGPVASCTNSNGDAHIAPFPHAAEIYNGGGAASQATDSNSGTDEPQGAHYISNLSSSDSSSSSSSSGSNGSLHHHASLVNGFTDNDPGLSSEVTYTELPEAERQGSHTCLGCQKPVQDRYVLHVRDHGYWHADCLRCCTCQVNLSGQASCYVRDERVFCRTDYNVLFGLACVKCSLHFKKDEDWMRVAGQHRYHIACFLCKICKRQLGSNERYHLVNGSDIYCTNHYRDLVNGDNSDGQHPPKKAKRNRTSYTESQIKFLQDRFNIDSNPDGNELEKIASRIGLKKRVVQVWFQNNRARLKKTANNTKGGNQENKNPSTSNGLTTPGNLQDDIAFEWDHSMEPSMDSQGYPQPPTPPLHMLTAPSSSHFLNSYAMPNTLGAGPMGAQATSTSSAHGVLQGPPSNGDVNGGGADCIARPDQVSPHQPNDTSLNGYHGNNSGGSPDYANGCNILNGGVHPQHHPQHHQHQHIEISREQQASPQEFLSNRRSETQQERPDARGGAGGAVMYPDQFYGDGSSGGNLSLPHQHHHHPHLQHPFNAYSSHNGHPTTTAATNGDVYASTTSYMAAGYQSYPSHHQHHHQHHHQAFPHAFPGGPRDPVSHNATANGGATFNGEGVRSNGVHSHMDQHGGANRITANDGNSNNNRNNNSGSSSGPGVQVEQVNYPSRVSPGHSQFSTAQPYNHSMAPLYSFTPVRGYLGEEDESP